jgi:hypothetical protein
MVRDGAYDVFLTVFEVVERGDQGDQGSQRTRDD